MKTELEQFAWGRPIDGYTWENAVAADFRVFGPAASASANRDSAETRFLRWRDAGSGAETLTPLSDHPTLFREFACLEPTEAAFLEFANQHGWLGVSCFLKESREGGKSFVVNLDSTRGQGEPLWRWTEAHEQMQKVNDVLSAIQSKDLARLGEWFRVENDAVRFEREWPSGAAEYEWVCGTKSPALRTLLWQWGNQAPNDGERLLRFASVWAQKRINEAMHSGDRGTSSSVRVLMNHIKDGMMLHIVPDSLLAAMWLQCARVLTDNPTFKACERCGKWFELSPVTRRKQSKYCSGSCKVAAHRARTAGANAGS
jgi:hypothetical protein